jgi:hypothetical protein
MQGIALMKESSVSRDKGSYGRRDRMERGITWGKDCMEATGGSQMGMECIHRPTYWERACLYTSGRILFFEEGA